MAAAKSIIWEKNSGCATKASTAHSSQAFLEKSACVTPGWEAGSRQQSWVSLRLPASRSTSSSRALFC